jgi:hypothetical protein
MLSRIKGSAKRAWFGVAALALAAPLAMPAAASASTTFQNPFNSRYPQAVTYTNSDNALSLLSGRTDFSAKFQLDQSSASDITLDNKVNAFTALCHDCGTVAIGFQVLYVAKADLTTLNTNNNVNATVSSCVRCTNLAEAYIIVVADGPQAPPLTGAQLQDLKQVQIELEALRYSHDSDSEIVTQTTTLAGDVKSILTDPSTVGPDVSPAVTPAINGANSNGTLTGTNQPIIDMFRSVKY